MVNSVIAASIGAALAARITSAAPVPATGPPLSESLAGGPPAAVVESKGPLGSAPEGSDVFGKIRTTSINEAAFGDFFGITPFERLFDAVGLRQGVFGVEEEFRGDGVPVVVWIAISAVSSTATMIAGPSNPAQMKRNSLPLPFLVMSLWVLVVLTVAGLQYFYGNWRLRQWLNHLRAKGIVPRVPTGRRHAEPKATSSRRKRTRLYVG